MKFCFALSFGPLDHYVPLARAADESGWDAVACSDHVVNPETITSVYPYTADGGRRWEPFTPWPDCWVSIGAMAAVTERLNFFTNVYVLPMRNPFNVAKSVGTAAVLSNNRVALGVGMGWMEEEFDALEQPFAGRGKRADEMIDVLRTLWSGGWVDHHGDFYDFDKIEMTPTPTRQVPIYVGGISNPAFRRAARNDGWVSDMHTIAEFTDIRKRLDEERTALGRSGTDFAMIGSCIDAFDYDGYRRLEAAGVTHLLTMPWVFYSGMTDVLQEKIDGVHRFADDIISRFT
ncbi:MAG TPA: TIGR03619 family F420-dependent LLM class oxidoreductase [Acidimicrobiales bacterium]|nr:TIGR03619 family F420-dependent LLM class oxidoreductase [Acidimicrobiales bacterium]